MEKEELNQDYLTAQQNMRVAYMQNTMATLRTVQVGLAIGVANDELPDEFRHAVKRMCMQIAANVEVRNASGG